MAAATAEWMRGLRGEQIVLPTAEEAARFLATRLAGHLHHRLAEVSHAHLALSGGSSTTLLGSTLTEGSPLTTLDWSRIHVWLVDERCVPAGDPRLNATLIRDTLVARVPLPATNWHPMPAQDADGAARYEAMSLIHI